MAFPVVHARMHSTFALQDCKPVAGAHCLTRASANTKNNSLRKQNALRCHQHSVKRLMGRQQGAACHRAYANTTSELRTDEATPRSTVSETKRPSLMVLDVQLKDGPLEGEMTVQGSLDMEQLDQDKVFDLLTDHERSNDIFRAILDVETAHQPDGSIRLTQNCRWQFFIFSGSFPVELEVVENRAERSFTFKDIREGGLMEKMEGQWTVGPSEAIPNGVRVEHRLTVKMAIAAPPPFDAQTNKIFVNQVNDIMTDLQLAMEAKSSTLAGPVVSEWVAEETPASAPVNTE